MCYLGATYWELDRKAEAEVLFEELFARSRHEYVPSSVLTLARACQGRMDEAFALLKQAYEEHDGLLCISRYYPFFDALRAMRGLMPF